VGSEYFRAKYIVNEGNVANNLLSDVIIKYEPTQAICQLFWGRPDLKRINVYKLLVFEDYLNTDEFNEEDIGSYMMLLNKCKILTYDKKTTNIRILFNPRTSKPNTVARFLSPETPFSNLRNLWEVLRECNKFIHWFDKHFSTKGFEPLHDEADGNKITEIKILTGITKNINDRIYRNFKRFKKEMENRQIDCVFRVVCDKDLLNKIHDRWIISDNVCYNVPPINSIYQGQYSELKKTKIRPPYGEWWEKGLDLIQNWTEISSYFKNNERMT